MSIDLDWAQLDEELCARALEGINEALKNCKKPAFLGDIRATSFSLGRVSPQLEIVEIRDVFEEFLHVEHEDEEEEEALLDDEELEGYNDEMVMMGGQHIYPGSSKARGDSPLSPTNSLAAFSSGAAGAGRPLSTPGLYTPNAGLWMQRNSMTTASSSTNGTAGGYPFPQFGHAHVHSGGHIIKPRNQADPTGSSTYAEDQKNTIHHRNTHVDNDPLLPHPSESQSAIATNHHPSPTAGLSLQLHFRVKYLGNMSISLSTTLKVNYPSPSFMSLPLNLRITGLAFEGMLVVAYEGDKKRLHVSILDESDPNRTKIVKGANLLKHAFVESEVGQADKLVLKDVAKVEQFVLEMARKALQVRTSIDYFVRDTSQTECCSFINRTR